MRSPSATLLMIVFAGLANAAVPRSTSAQVIERRPAVHQFRHWPPLPRGRRPTPFRIRRSEA